MYQQLKILISFFLFTSLYAKSFEYYTSENNIPEMNISFEKPCSKTQGIPSHFHLRDRQLYRLIQNNISQQTSPSYYSQNTYAVLTDNISAIYSVHNGFKAQRQNAIEQFTHNNSDVCAIYYKNYFLPELSKKYLIAHNIDLEPFTSCEGNALQHSIHQEFIVLTDTTAHLWNERKNSSDVQELTTVIANFASAGVSFNHMGNIQKATTLADAGWAILDCIQAAGEGFIEGIASTTRTILHPIEAAQNLTHTITTCGYYLGIAFNEINTVAHALGDGKFDIAYNKYNIWSEHCKNITQALTEQCRDLKLRDVIKAVTQSAVECYATTRALNGFSTLFKHAHRNAAHIAQKISNGAQESTFLMSTEGIPIRIAQEVITQAEKLPRANDKLLQVLSKFESQKIKVGNITCVLDKSGLKHILERHHPLYWDGSLTTIQTFLDKKTTVQDIIHIIKQTIKQNKQFILQNKSKRYQIDGIIKNIKYTVGFERGRVGQFFIPINQSI
jgi:hypothetical protein